MFRIVDLGVRTTLCLLVHSDFDVGPHSVSTRIKAKILVEKIKHLIDLDANVCHGLFDADTCARQICWGSQRFVLHY